MFQAHIKQTLRFVIFVSLCTLISCNGLSREYVTIEGQALGTFVVIKHDSPLDSGSTVDMIKKVDKVAKSSMSIFDKNSLLSRVNRGETDSLDSHIVRNIELAKRFSELSDGNYDITIKPLTEAWGFAGKQNTGVTPNVDSLLQFVGYEKISIEDGRIVKADERIQIDLNSIAKGYTVDLMAEELEAMGIENYMVNIGGEIRCRGRNSRGGKWSIGVETPYDGNFEEANYEKIISRTDCAMATSGNYRRYYITEDGQKVAHTISPKTGYSAVSTLLSATVIATTCAEADAAATMFMALGSEGAVEVAKYCEEEYDWLYYFIFADGEGYRVECSQELNSVL